jgi:RNA polymerase sigma factor (sigma-70 family)
MPYLQKGSLDWWRMWLRRRSIDEYRQKFRRGRLRMTPGQFWTLDAGPSERRVTAELLLPPTQFEDALVELLDARAAIRRLPRHEAVVLALRARGYTPVEIAKLLGYTRGSVDSVTYRARARMKEFCAVSRATSNATAA